MPRCLEFYGIRDIVRQYAVTEGLDYMSFVLNFNLFFLCVRQGCVGNDIYIKHIAMLHFLRVRGYKCSPLCLCLMESALLLLRSYIEIVSTLVGLRALGPGSALFPAVCFRISTTHLANASAPRSFFPLLLLSRRRADCVSRRWAQTEKLFSFLGQPIFRVSRRTIFATKFPECSS